MERWKDELKEPLTNICIKGTQLKIHLLLLKSRCKKYGVMVADVQLLWNLPLQQT